MEEAARERQRRLATLRGTSEENREKTPSRETVVQPDQAPAQPGETLEERASRILQEALTEESPESSTIPLAELVPKKANWDLKADLEGRLAILEERTQQSIHDLVKHRVSQ